MCAPIKKLREPKDVPQRARRYRRAVSVTGSGLGRSAPRHDGVRLGLVLLLIPIDDYLMEVLTGLRALLV